MPTATLLKAAPEDLADVTSNLLRALRAASPFEPIQLVCASAPVGRLLIRHAARGASGTIAVNALTLHDLARRLAPLGQLVRAADERGAPSFQPGRRLPPLADRLIVAQLLADDRGRHGETVLRPAWVAAFARAIRDLREAVALPDWESVESDEQLLDFDALAGEGITRHEYEQIVHLRRLMRGFRERLHELRLLDDAAIYLEAARGASQATAGHLVIHGLYDLTGVQRELIRAITRSLPITWVFPEITERSSTERLLRATWDWAESQGFRDGPRPLASAERPEARILACPGEIGEARQIAREVLREAASGTAFGEMAVVLAHPKATRRLFVEELERARVPLCGAYGDDPLDRPAARALAALSRVLTGEPDPADFVAIVGSIAAADDTRLSGARVAALLRRAACLTVDFALWADRLIAHASDLERRADRLAVEQSETGRDGAEEGDGSAAIVLPGSLLEEARQSRDVARHVSDWGDRLATFRRRFAAAHDARELAAELECLVRGLGLPSSLADEACLAARRLEQLEQLGLPFRLDLVLEIWWAWINPPEEDDSDRGGDRDLDQIDPLRAGDGVLLGRSAEIGADAPRRPGEGVLVIDVNRARGLVAPIVFAAGLAQEFLVPPGTPDPLLGDRLRAKLREPGGVPLKTSSRRAEESDLLFAYARASGSAKVTLSWPRFEDATGQPRFPADPLASEIERRSGTPLDADDPASAACVARIPASLPDVTKPGERPILDAAEYDLASAVSGDPRRYGHLLDREDLARCLGAHRARWIDRRLTEHDGMIGPEVAAPDHFSPTSLERVAVCPFRYLLGDLLRLPPPCDEDETLEPEPQELGRLAHAALEELFGTLRGLPEGDRPPVEALLPELDRSLRRHAERMAASGGPGRRALWLAVARQMRGALSRFVIEELRFLRDQNLTVEAVEAPVEDRLVLGQTTLTVRGRPDRIDRRSGGQLVITDYKYSTGARARSQGGDALLSGGSQLQIPLYARLLSESLAEGDARPELLRLVFLRDGARRRSAEIPIASIDARREDIEELVTRLVGLVREGLLFQVPGAQCDYCDYRAVCGPAKEALGECKQDDPHRARQAGLAGEFP